jgi:hypothetical protein
MAGTNFQNELHNFRKGRKITIYYVIWISPPSPLRWRNIPVTSCTSRSVRLSMDMDEEKLMMEVPVRAVICLNTYIWYSILYMK